MAPNAGADAGGYGDGVTGKPIDPAGGTVVERSAPNPACPPPNQFLGEVRLGTTPEKGLIEPLDWYGSKLGVPSAAPATGAGAVLGKVRGAGAAGTAPRSGNVDGRGTGTNCVAGVPLYRYPSGLASVPAVPAFCPNAGKISKIVKIADAEIR